MNKKQQLVRKKHRRTKTRLKALRVLSLSKMKKKTKAIKPIEEQAAIKKTSIKKTAIKKTSIKKTAIKKTSIKKTTTKKTVTKKTVNKKK